MTPTVHHCQQVEARLLAAMLVEEGVLELAVMLELDDLSTLRNKAILAAIRELQQTNSPVNALSVADAIEMRDLANDSHVADFAGVDYIGQIICETTNYSHWQLVAADIRHLRALSRYRVTT